MVLLEAKAHALPIVSFDCPTGPREIVRADVDGFLIQNDTSRFAHAAERLMVDPDLRQRMGTAGLEDFCARFSATRIVPRWYDLIERLHDEEIAPK